MTAWWGAGLAAAAAWGVGWAVDVSAPIAYSFAGSGFSISPSETFAIVEAGNAMLLGAAGILLGLTLIALFFRGRTQMSSWLRWVTLIAGIIGLGSPVFFPWFALLIWGVIAGVWLVSAQPALN